MKNNLSRFLRYLPLLAPIPEGWAVGLAIQRELGWWMPIVVISALIVAGTGFWGVQVFNRMNDFNATLRADERTQKMSVPTWKAGVILGVWFAGVTLLTVFLDLVPLLKLLTPLGLVVVGFSAAYLFSLSNLCATREEERMAYRHRKESERMASRNRTQEEKKQKKAQAQQLAIVNQKIRSTLQERGIRKRQKSGGKLDDATLLLYWTRDPYLTSHDMVEALVGDGVVEKISRQAIDQRKKKMIERGLIVENPDGRIVEYINSGAGESVGVVSGEGEG